MSRTSQNTQEPSLPQLQAVWQDELPIVVRRKEFAWILGRSLSSLSHQETQEPEELCNATQVPVWSAYNSLIYDPLDTTRSATPPLIAAPAHEWSTLLTVLKQAQNINTLVVGADRKTVVTLDLGLYQPAKRLQMARDDMDHLILRSGAITNILLALLALYSIWSELTTPAASQEKENWHAGKSSVELIKM